MNITLTPALKSAARRAVRSANDYCAATGEWHHDIVELAGHHLANSEKALRGGNEHLFFNAGRCTAVIRELAARGIIQ